MRLTLEQLKKYKKALADLDMSATEFLLYSVEKYYAYLNEDVTDTTNTKEK
jgi:hypothetical protein